jgi:hemerythrin-like domain-containing protein
MNKPPMRPARPKRSVAAAKSPAPASLTFMRSLRADHADYSQVLSLLSREVRHLAERVPSTLRLLREAFEYITLYLDTHHHPREDVLYERLALRSRRHARALATLRLEHRIGTSLSQRIASALDELLEGGLRGRLARLEEDIDRFIEEARNHIVREERLMYSRATAILTREDWRDIERAAPLSDARIGLVQGGAQRYPLLSRYLRKNAPPHVVLSDEASLAEGLGLDKAGELYGTLVGGTIEAVALTARQQREALHLVLRSFRVLCTPRAPARYLGAMSAMYRTDTDALRRWIGEWSVHLRLSPRRRPHAAARCLA